MPILWPFRPNWRASVEVTPEYRTDIVTSRSGKEQRIARRRQPRRALSFTTTVAGSDRQRFIQVLGRRQNETVLLADPTRKFRLSADSDAGSGVFTLYEIPNWLVAGRKIVIGDAVFTVTGIDETEITFTPVNASEIPAGTIARPALTGLIAGTVGAAHPVSRVAEARITFAVEPGSEPVDAGSPGVYILDGREVFMLRPNWAEAVDQNLDWPIEQVDFGHGVVTNYTPIEHGTLTQTATFVGADPDTIQAIEAFFHRQLGRRGEFHMPTGTDDMVIAAPLSDGGSTLQVSGRDIYDNFNADPRFRAIALRTRDGRTMLRSVESLSLSGGDTVLTVTQPWLVDVTVAEVSSISWVPIFRFNSDDLTFEHPVEDVAEVQLSMRSLEHTEAENPIEGLDEAAQWVLEAWSESLLDDLDYLVNVRYPAIFYDPLAWIMVNGSAADALDFLVNVEIPESIG